jgi:hypothetical protein
MSACILVTGVDSLDVGDRAMVVPTIETADE